MKIFGLVGWSGSGKTTLMKMILPELISRGIRVSTIKHTHHDFDIDKPGKDSFTHREAGATEVLIAGDRRWALLHENRGVGEPSMDELIERLEPVDLVLIEGFKSYNHNKLEVYRPSHGKEMLAKGDHSVIAVATDEVIEQLEVPVLDLNDVAAVATFIIDYCELKTGAVCGAA